MFLSAISWEPVSY